MSTPSEPPERRFTLDLRTGEIRPAGAPDRRDDEEQWVPLGELGPNTGGLPRKAARSRRGDAAARPR